MKVPTAMDEIQKREDACMSSDNRASTSESSTLVDMPECVTFIVGPTQGGVSSVVCVIVPTVAVPRALNLTKFRGLEIVVPGTSDTIAALPAATQSFPLWSTAPVTCSLCACSRDATDPPAAFWKTARCSRPVTSGTQSG